MEKRSGESGRGLWYFCLFECLCELGFQSSSSPEMQRQPQDLDLVPGKSSWQELFPFRLLRQFGCSSVFGACYHMVADTTPAHIRHLFLARSIARFRQDLEFLLRNFFIIDPLEIRRRLEDGGQSLRGGFIVTFDDGLREAAEIAAPILMSYGVPAVFFINPAFADNRSMFHRHKASLAIDSLSVTRDASAHARVVDCLRGAGVSAQDAVSGIHGVGYGQRHVLDEVAKVLGLDIPAYLKSEQPYMSTSLIRGLSADGFLIGAHSVDHPLFSSISAEEQLLQVRDSVDYVRAEHGVEDPLFAFPFNTRGVSDAVWEMARRHGPVLFGTGGCGHDIERRLVERVTMERPPTACALANRALLKNILGRFRRS